jgi:hypothetical protein
MARKQTETTEQKIIRAQKAAEALWDLLYNTRLADIQDATDADWRKPHGDQLQLRASLHTTMAYLEDATKRTAAILRGTTPTPRA